MATTKMPAHAETAHPDVAADGTDGNSATDGAPRPDGTAGTVWDAVTANPGATTMTVAKTARVSRTAATKILKGLAADGHVVRNRPAKKGGSDTWTPAPATVDTTATEPATDNPPPNGDIPGGAPEISHEATEREPAPADPPPESGNDTADGAGTAGEATDPPPAPGTPDADTPDAAAVAEARQLLDALANLAGAACTDLDAGDVAGALTRAEQIFADSGKVRRAARHAAKPPKNGDGGNRSRPGELRTKVRDHLDAHPGAEFTPYEIGRVIGHSSGAVANALDKLTADGTATETCERPRRFTSAIPAAA